MERYARSNFLRGRVIELRTREVEEANAALLARNVELAESRAATIRSARRSELIFSALSEALPGTVLDDKYRVEEKIGSGAFGTVYRGEHLLLHHAVAIKVFRPSVGQGALESLERFRLEGISACRMRPCASPWATSRPTASRVSSSRDARRRRSRERGGHAIVLGRSMTESAEVGGTASRQPSVVSDQ